VVIVLALASSQNIRDRVTKESDIIVKIATLQWDNIPMTSVGIRFNSWIESIKYIEKSPLIGTSKESIKLVTQQSEKFQASPKARNIGHLHNYYLETLVAFGVIGLIFIVIYYRHIYIRIKNHNSDAEFLLFLAFLIFWLIINNFESFNSKFYGLYIQNIVFAGIYCILQEGDTSRLGGENVD
jgi:O-antigen ligase